jgi:DNA-binding IclR family transcriptional regulator
MNAITSLIKGLDILTILGGKPEGMTIPGLVEALNLSRSTVIRVMDTLLVYGLVERDGRRVKCSDSFTNWASNDRHMEDRRRYRVVLEGIAREIGELVLLGVLEGSSVVHLDFIEADHAVRVAPAPHTRHNLRVNALGKYALSRRPDLAHAWIRNDPALARELDEIREIGVSWNREESTSGVIAMATRGFSDSPTEPMIAVAWPTFRFSEAKAAEALAVIRLLTAST